ncbi:DUF2637 domain-containing protein [Streptomyces sp. NPDC047974]|uniref:DUF2637 domain-containing protein n=1 Tax=Streptomyces sp. NPDC047974 TaxID=3154343 RepID=UPI0033FB4AAD
MTDPRTGLAQLTGARKKLAVAVGAGALVIASIGFAGSYGAVVDLAVEKDFGNFAHVFPIGIDAGIAVLLALDLLLTWIRIPFPVLRHMAWLLTAATIAFNAAAAWPDPIAVGMHATMPMLFVVVVEAVRHAVGRLADITADKHMDGVRFWRWFLSPAPTFRLWRRMKLWELRSYDQTVRLEQDRLIYQAQLQAKYGRRWRRRAPVEAVMPLRLAKLGVPLAETAPAGLAAADILIEWRPVPSPVIAPAPAFEEHALAAIEVVGIPVHEYADTPSTPAPGHADHDAEEPPSLRAARVPVLAANTPRQEVRVRIPVRDRTEPEETGQAEAGQAEKPSVAPAPEGPDTQANGSDDESTNPQVPPVSPEPKNPLAARNARASEAAAKRYTGYAEGWAQAQKDTPDVTFAEYAEQLGVSARTLRRALADKTTA